MASGKTNEMIAFSQHMDYRRVKPFEKKDRDRSLRGKARVKARKQKR